MAFPNQGPAAPGSCWSFSWHQPWSLHGFWLETPTQFPGSALVKRVGKYNPEEKVKKKAKFMWGQQNIPEQIEMSLLFPSLSPLRTRKRRFKSNRLGAECMKPPLVWIFLLSAPSLPPLFPQFSLQAGGAQPRGCPGVHGHTWRGHRDTGTAG